MVICAELPLYSVIYATVYISFIDLHLVSVLF